MIRPFSARPSLGVAAFSVALGLLLCPRAVAQQAPAPPAPQAPSEGQFFTIEEPITSEVINRVRTQTLHYLTQTSTGGDGARPVLIFEIRPGRAGPGQSEFGAARDLAEFISTKLSGARQTVAFLPQPVSGYACLVALACGEIVMGSDSAFGPITPEGQDVDPLAREYMRILAHRTGREEDLLQGMVDRNANLLKVNTGDRQVHYVLASHLNEFRRTHQVSEQQPAWEGGQRGILSSERARSEGFAKRNADQRSEVANIYNLAGRAATDDPTLDQVLSPVWIRLTGPLDTIKASYLKRRIEQARQEKVNLIFFEINSEGGLDDPADNIAEAIAEIKDMKTVAYINDRALGVAALVPLACDKIVFAKQARMGDVTRLITGHGGQMQPLTETQIAGLAAKAGDLARRKGHPPAVAQAMVDPNVAILAVKDTQTGAAALVTDAEVQAAPGRFVVQETRKPKGEPVLELNAETAIAFRMANDVVSDADGLKDIFGLRGKDIREDGPTWVDSLVTTLNTDWMSWLLLFIGFFMLVLELKLPGIGLPAILSALAFLLFFWSRYLSGTADQLEILLFVVGLICLGLELFVFPGLGVFGMSGVLLILVSVVMASHTFVWPTQEYEYRQMLGTLIQVTLVLLMVGGGAIMVGRFLPSLPLFNRIVLKPAPSGGSELGDQPAKPASDNPDSLAYLIGETGRTTSVLRPTGKARFGDLLVDATADGYYIEPNSLVEVVDVRGARVIVKPA